ncbi:hypothetical protein [Halovenus marina]|uniref:hypothetical protein n=1 Tax=Halovenus marina TaxID=3396621 RepID=UPI003F56BD34
MGKRALALVGCLVVLVCTGGCLGFGDTDERSENVTPTETPPAGTETPTATPTPTETPERSNGTLAPDVREQGYANFTAAFEESLDDPTAARLATPSVDWSVVSLAETTQVRDTLEIALTHENGTYHPMYATGTALEALADTIDGPGTALDRDFVAPAAAGKFPLIPPEIRIELSAPIAGETITLTVDSDVLAQYGAGEMSREAFADEVLASAVAESETVSPYADQHPERYLPGGDERPTLESTLLANTRTGDVVRLEPKPIEDADGTVGVEVFLRDRNATDEIVSKRAGELLHELARNVNRVGMGNLSADRAGEQPLAFVAVTTRGETADEWVTTHAPLPALDAYYHNQTSKAALADSVTTLASGPTPAQYRAHTDPLVTGLTRATYRDFAAKYGRDLEAREETLFGWEPDVEVKRVQGQAEYGDAQIMVEPKDPGLTSLYAEQMILTLNETAPHLHPERGILVYLDNPTPAHYEEEAGDHLIFLNTSGALELTDETINPWNFRYDLNSPEHYLPPGQKRSNDPFFEEAGPAYWGDVPVENTK